MGNFSGKIFLNPLFVNCLRRFLKSGMGLEFHLFSLGKRAVFLGIYAAEGSAAPPPPRWQTPPKRHYFLEHHCHSGYNQCTAKSNYIFIRFVKRAIFFFGNLKDKFFYFIIKVAPFFLGHLISPYAFSIVRLVT